MGRLASVGPLDGNLSCMRTILALCGLGLLSFGAGCANELREAHLSDPVVGQDGTVWWAEHRAHERGANATRVIMCRRGERPVCVRVRPVDSGAR